VPLEVFVIKGVHRLAVLEHDEVGDVDKVVDRPHARGAEPFPHPPRRRGDLDIFDHAGDVAAAELRIPNLHGEQVADVAGLMLNDGV
jgi:hypothetical protein